MRNYTEILRSHKCGIINTRFLTFIRWRKTGKLKNFYSIPVVRDIGASAFFGVKCPFTHHPQETSRFPN